MNHANEIRALARLGLVSAYHLSRGVEAGEEPEPTLYWRDRTALCPRGMAGLADYPVICEPWSPGQR